MGILYLLVILAQCKVGWKIINDALIKGDNRQVSDVLHFFEKILCFDSWINQSKFWSSDQNIEYIQSCTKSIQMMMKAI